MRHLAVVADGSVHDAGAGAVDDASAGTPQRNDSGSLIHHTTRKSGPVNPHVQLSLAADGSVHGYGAAQDDHLLAADGSVQSTSADAHHHIPGMEELGTGEDDNEAAVIDTGAPGTMHSGLSIEPHLKENYSIGQDMGETSRIGGTRRSSTTTVFDAEGVQRVLHTDALIAEQFGIVHTSKHFTDQQLQIQGIANQDLHLTNLKLGALIGCIILMLLMFLFLLCCLRGSRWLALLINSKMNPKARLAILAHRRGNEKPSWQLFFEYMQLESNPFQKRWVEQMEDEAVEKQIDATFDALRGPDRIFNSRRGPLDSLTQDDVKSLLDGLEGELKLFSEGGERRGPWLEATKDDLEWLLDSWDEIFPADEPLDRSAFPDLCKLLVTWWHIRAVAHGIFLEKAMFMGRSTIDRIDLSGMTMESVSIAVSVHLSSCEPIHLFKYTIGSMESNVEVSERGRISFETSALEREYVPSSQLAATASSMAAEKQIRTGSYRLRRLSNMGGSSAVSSGQAPEQHVRGRPDGTPDRTGEPVHTGDYRKSRSQSTGRGQRGSMKEWYPRAASRDPSREQGRARSQSAGRQKYSEQRRNVHRYSEQRSRSPGDPPPSAPKRSEKPRRSDASDASEGLLEF